MTNPTLPERTAEGRAARYVLSIADQLGARAALRSLLIADSTPDERRTLRDEYQAARAALQADRDRLAAARDAAEAERQREREGLLPICAAWARDRLRTLPAGVDYSRPDGLFALVWDVATRAFADELTLADRLAERLDLAPAQVEAIVSFYASRERPQGVAGVVRDS